MWVSLLLVLGCTPKVYTPPPPAEPLGLASSEGDGWGILEQASTLSDVSVRQRANYFLVRFWHEEGGGSWAQRGLHDPNPYVQRRSIEALAERIHEPTSLALLNSFAQRESADPYSRGKAAFYLAQAKAYESLPSLVIYLQSEAHHSEHAPIALAAHMMGDPSALGVLIEAIKRGDFPLEVDFFLDCAAANSPDLAKALEEGLMFLEEELHLAVASSLIRLNSKKGVDLFEAALFDDNIERQHEALDFLTELHTPESLALLQKATRRSAPTAAKHARIVLEARNDNFPVASTGALNSIDREERKLGLQTLLHWASRHSSQKRSIQKIRKSALSVIADLETSVQKEALKLLGYTGLPKDKTQIEAFLNSENPSLRVEAAGALFTLEARATSEP